MASFLLDGRISYWKLNEAAGSNRLDSIVATGNDLAEIGGNVTQGSPLFTGSINSAQFSGSGPYLRDATPTGLNFGAGSFTIAAWINIAATTTLDQGCVCKFQPSGNQRQFALFYFNVNANMRFGVSGDGSNDFSIDDTVTNVFGVTYLVCAWYDGSANTVNIQTDNATINSAAGPASVFGSTAGLDVGRFDVTVDRIWNGRIDEVGIWNRLLTTQEKGDLYNGGAGLPFSQFKSSGVVGEYHFYWQDRIRRRR